MTGRRFERLAVIRRTAPPAHLKRKESRFWECRCDCGSSVVLSSTALVKAQSRSCGCLQRDTLTARNTTHGMTNSRAYRLWLLMKQRCSASSGNTARHYRTKGVSIAPEWFDFERFLADMGEPGPEDTLDRIDNGKGYGPDNCRWATRAEQVVNRTNTIWLEVGGVKKTLTEWAQTAGLKRAALYSRIFTLGWDAERAVSTPASGSRGISGRPSTQKQKARRAVAKALTTGDLVKPTHCSFPGCFREDIEAHHHNGYEDEYVIDVVWVCPGHHRKENERLVEWRGESRTVREWANLLGIPRIRLTARLERNDWVVDDATFATVDLRRRRDALKEHAASE